MSTQQIVVIGASFGGLGVAQGLLKTVIPQLSQGGKQHYKVVQIAPNDEFFWKIGAPRVIAKPKDLPLEKALIPIAPHFKNYKPEEYEFIKAYVTSIDPSTKTVHTSTSAAIHYDALVIASGTTFASNLWAVSDGSEPLKNAIAEIHQRLPNAQSVLVAGGGAAGVETAGELGEAYGKKKEITLLSGTTGLLHRLQNKKMGQDAQSRLEKMGVKVINDGVKVVEHTTTGGKEVLKLSNGETKTVDVYIEAIGDKPSTKFVPQEWLDENQRVKTDAHTLRLDVPGVEGVYCIGSAASYSDGSVLDIKFAKPAILESIKLDLQGQGMFSPNPGLRFQPSLTPTTSARPSLQEHLQENHERHAVRAGRFAGRCRHRVWLQAPQLHGQDGQEQGLHDR
jgi:NADH dehydrogenase FAD-containing subunit